MIEQVLKRLKIEKLNEMQLASLNAIEKGDDVILLSPTGSGKTLGFLLPILKKLEVDKSGVQALVIVPSRELGLQIESVFKQMATGFKVNCCYGGHATKTEKNNFEKAPALLIGTPGRLAYHIERRSFDTNTVFTLVLDEFDKALEFGFETDMSYIIQQLPNIRQRILTSATNALEIPTFTGVKSPITLNFMKASSVRIEGLQLKMVKAEGTDKLQALFQLICKLGSSAALVFCNHRDAVERISELLIDKEIVHDIFHGGMEQEDRERALIKFRNGSHRLLITTDLASRGLDIPEIENVVHYQLPLTESAFLHRNGRTARMHAKGTSYLLLSEEDQLPTYLKDEPINETLPEEIILPQATEWITLYIGGGKKDKINKMDIVGMLLQKGNLQKDELGLIEVLDYTSYAAVKRNRIAKVIALIKDERIKKKKLKMEVSR